MAASLVLLVPISGSSIPYSVFRILSPVSSLLSNKHRSAVDVDYKPGQKTVTHQFKRE